METLPKTDAKKNASSGKKAHSSAPTNAAPRAKSNTQKGHTPRYDEQEIPGQKLKIIPLGGLSEIGKNMTVIEYGDDIIVIDCGLGFPEEDMPGIDLVIPDVTYLEENKEKIRGIFLTHGHEDHIGAIPYVLRQIDLPIYGTNLTLGIVKNKLKEVTLPYQPKLNCVKAGDTIKVGRLSVEFIHVNHSIADACALAIRTPVGMIVHSGDFKLDLSPIDGEIMDITRFGELGKEGVLLLMCESTNAERPGTTPSEKKVGASLEYIFTVQKDKRIVISTFSSNVHRVQQIIDVAARHGRKVAITGRSMLNIVGAAVELGYMHVPEGVLIDVAEMRKYSPHEVALVTTGSQGEPMSALYRMAFGEHREVRLGAGDVVVLSSSSIPGNEKLINRIVNELCKLGAQVIRDAAVEVHVSGHACQEEIKLLYALTKPKYFMPVHGEYKHMAANRELAMYMGMDPRNIFISDIGKVLEIDKKSAKWGGTVASGKVLIDGSGVGDVGNIVLRDRILLSQDGVIIVVATVSADGGYIMSGPDIVTRGFVYVRESEDLMEEMKNIAQKSMMSCLGGKYHDWFRIKTKVKDDLSKYIYTKTKRKPMIIPMIMNV
ncbi:MAG: ribonuclease J [Ruminococcaceae bacterium]|nr:ribonuclease J [Oscillospiraceae bacterium]